MIFQVPRKKARIILLKSGMTHDTYSVRVMSSVNVAGYGVDIILRVKSNDLDNGYK